MLKIRASTGGRIAKRVKGEYPFIYRQKQQGLLTPAPTYLWPVGDAGAGRPLGEAGMQLPRGCRGAGPFLSTVDPLLSACLLRSYCSVQLEEERKGGLSWIM